MKAKLDASRALLYETTRCVDMYKAYNALAEDRTLSKEERLDNKKYQRLADALTPQTKMFASEYANQNAYDCIQIHGGSGFMKDYLCERLYRDARILTIYEGTSQLQVVAAIRYVTTGLYISQLKEYQGMKVAPELDEQKQKLVKMIDTFEEVSKSLEEAKDNELLDFHARRLVEMAGLALMSALLLIDATRDNQFTTSARVFVNYAEAESAKHAAFIHNFDKKDMTAYKLDAE
jgi:hypothetical protein